MFVKKRGSQSGPTGGQVVGYHPIVPWLFGQPPLGHQYVMTGQYEIFYNPLKCPDGIFSKGGDSGSLVLQDGTQTAVGLLWGRGTAGRHTRHDVRYHNRRATPSNHCRITLSLRLG
jgi:hypothetical protein